MQVKVPSRCYVASTGNRSVKNYSGAAWRHECIVRGRHSSMVMMGTVTSSGYIICCTILRKGNFVVCIVVAAVPTIKLRLRWCD